MNAAMQAVRRDPTPLRRAYVLTDSAVQRRMEALLHSLLDLICLAHTCKRFLVVYYGIIDKKVHELHAYERSCFNGWRPYRVMIDLLRNVYCHACLLSPHHQAHLNYGSFICAECKKKAIRQCLDVTRWSSNNKPLAWQVSYEKVYIPDLSHCSYLESLAIYDNK
jgi:hypothetical protein